MQAFGFDNRLVADLAFGALADLARCINRCDFARNNLRRLVAALELRLHVEQVFSGQLERFFELDSSVRTFEHRIEQQSNQRHPLVEGGV